MTCSLLGKEAFCRIYHSIQEKTPQQLRGPRGPACWTLWVPSPLPSLFGAWPLAPAVKRQQMSAVCVVKDHKPIETVVWFGGMAYVKCLPFISGHAGCFILDCGRLCNMTRGTLHRSSLVLFTFFRIVGSVPLATPGDSASHRFTAYICLCTLGICCNHDNFPMIP